MNLRYGFNYILPFFDVSLRILVFSGEVALDLVNQHVQNVRSLRERPIEMLNYSG